MPILNYFAFLGFKLIFYDYFKQFIAFLDVNEM